MSSFNGDAVSFFLKPREYTPSFARAIVDMLPRLQAQDVNIPVVARMHALVCSCTTDNKKHYKTLSPESDNRQYRYSSVAFYNTLH